VYRIQRTADRITADLIRCEECGRAVDEFTAIAERWGFWSDGCGELLPFCPECAGASLRTTLGWSSIPEQARRHGVRLQSSAVVPGAVLQYDRRQICAEGASDGRSARCDGPRYGSGHERGR
jgi:hypothetical protein